MQSVHLLNFPKPSFKIDTDIVFNMDLIKLIVAIFKLTVNGIMLFLLNRKNNFLIV